MSHFYCLTCLKPIHSFEFEENSGKCDECKLDCTLETKCNLPKGFCLRCEEREKNNDKKLS